MAQIKMSPKVKSFIKDVLERKREQLMGVELDLLYYKKIVGAEDEEEKTRAELVEEQQKYTAPEKDEAGTVIKEAEDNRDLQKIAVLNGRIDEISKANQELNGLKSMKVSLERYYNYTTNLPADVIESLEKISKK